MERYLSAADQVSALAVGDPAILPGLVHLSRARRHVAVRSRRRAAPRHARRADGAADAAARRRIRDQGEAAADQPRIRPRPRVPPAARNLGGRRARAPRADGRARGFRHPPGQRRGDRRSARRAPRRSCADCGRPARRHRDLRAADRRAGRPPPAAVPAQQRRRNRSHRPAAHRELHDHRPVRRDRRPATRRAGAQCSLCVPASAVGREKPVRDQHHVDAGPPRLPPARVRGRHGAPDAPLRERPPGRHFRSRRPVRAARHPRQRQVRVSRRARPARSTRGQRHHAGQRSRARVAAVVLPLELHPGRRTADASRARAG